MRRILSFKALKIVLGLALAGLLALVGIVWAAGPSVPAGAIVLGAQVPYTHGPWFAYTRAWGGEMVPIMKYWAPYADKVVLEPKKFPNETTIYWRWPPITAKFGPGVWGYSAVMHGNYDGGETDERVPPVRVRDVHQFSQSFAWTLSNDFGDGNVLTEFYLRSSDTDPDAKLLEIGWFLHMPATSNKFFKNADDWGTFVAPDGTRWEVRTEDKFCMFAPEKGGDIRSGTLDMAAALRWLQAQKRITGDEWLWGVSMGVESVDGIGHFKVDRWSVTRN
jgi:hypothetical protein